MLIFLSFSIFKINLNCSCKKFFGYLWVITVIWQNCLALKFLIQGADIELSPPYYSSTVVRGWQLHVRTLYIRFFSLEIRYTNMKRTLAVLKKNKLNIMRTLWWPISCKQSSTLEWPSKSIIINSIKQHRFNNILRIFVTIGVRNKMFKFPKFWSRKMLMIFINFQKSHFCKKKLAVN